MNKIALVTGGSRGLGKDMALNIAKKGIDLVITYHNNEEGANKTAQEIKKLGQEAHVFQLDTRDVSSFDHFLKNMSSTLKEKRGSEKIDFLVNNAGIGIYKPFSETTEEDFDELMNTNFKGVYFLTQKALEFMNDEGRIINISSGLARFSLPGSSAYGPMKAAIDSFTRYLAKELAPRKIRANVVAPGAIATDFGGGENRDNEKKREVVAANTALGRVGEPEDIGGVVAFLCTEDARWINGQRIEATGGMML
ncbi:SDR family NAD(P)-dependent oxidoreductase [Halocola ammonii]